MIDLSLKSLMSHSELARPAAWDHAGRTVGNLWADTSQQLHSAPENPAHRRTRPESPEVPWEVIDEELLAEVNSYTVLSEGQLCLLKIGKYSLLNQELSTAWGLVL